MIRIIAILLTAAVVAGAQTVVVGGSGGGGGGSVSALTDIGDVDASPSTNDILQWDGDSWSNPTLVGAIAASYADNQILKGTGAGTAALTNILTAVGEDLTNDRIPYVNSGALSVSNALRFESGRIGGANTGVWWVETSNAANVIYAFRGDDTTGMTRASAGVMDFKSAGTTVATVGSTFRFRVPQGADVASAATIAPAGRLIYITGTTNIATINTCSSVTVGADITLVFADALTVQDGAGNLQLAGDFTTTTDDVLRLACTYNGSAYRWLEIARSVN